MRKISLSLLATICFINHSYGQLPWDAVCGDRLTDSILMNPQGSFSNHKVAVIDNGFASEHPLIKNQLVEGWNGRDLNEDVEASIVKDVNHHENGKTASHGTHVAGIVAQMTPYLDIIPCKRGSSGNRSSDSDKASLEYLLTRDDVKIVNLSFGIDWTKLANPIQKLAEQGKLIVIAAGNSGKTLREKNVAEFLKKPELKGRVILVGATEEKNGVKQLTSFSNKPSKNFESLFIAAPGKQITSSVPYNISKTGMKECNGTSMAAPVVAAALARLMTEFNASADEVREILFETAVKKNNDKHNTAHTGQGIMDFVAARNELKKRALIKKEALAFKEVPALLPIIDSKPIVSPIPLMVQPPVQIPVMVQPPLQIPVMVQPPVQIPVMVQEPKVKLVKQAETAPLLAVQAGATLHQQPQGWYSYGKQVLSNAISNGTSLVGKIYNKVASVAKNLYSYLPSWY